MGERRPGGGRAAITTRRRRIFGLFSSPVGKSSPRGLRTNSEECEGAAGARCGGKGRNGRRNEQRQWGNESDSEGDGDIAAKVLVTRRLPQRSMDRLRGGLRDLGDPGLRDLHLWDSDDPIPRARLLELLTGAAGLLCLLTDRIDAEALDRAGPDLRAVSNMAVGFDNIDVPAATRRGVLVCNTPGVLTETTADLTWALILAACRRVGEAVDFLREGRWETWRPLELAGVDVHGATLGVVGAGRIGRAVARRAAGFGMKVIYHSRIRRPEFEEIVQSGSAAGTSRLEVPDPDGSVESGPAANGSSDLFRPHLDDLLGEADIVTLHVPLTDQTRHLIDRRALSLMKPTAVLVNTSRGPVVDEEALAGALAERRIFSAGLDVYEREPLGPNSPLLGLPNVILLPHIGSATVATRTRMADLAVDNLLLALAGGRPAAAVNPEVLEERAAGHPEASTARHDSTPLHRRNSLE